MPPKARSRAPKAAPKPVPRPVKRNRDASPPTLLEKADAVEEPVKRRRLQARKTDDQVNKCLTDHFAGWTTEAVDMRVRNSKSLRERLTIDKRASREGRLTMGKCYYVAMRRLYGDDNSPARLLQVANKADPLDTDLEKALNLLRDHGQRAPLSGWLHQDRDINQRNLVGLLRAMCESDPAASAASCGMNMEVLQYIERKGYHEKFKQEHTIMLWHWDATLDKSFCLLKASGLSAKVWWASHKAEAAIVIDVNAFAACMECQTSWGDVADQLTACVSFAVGMRIFAGPFASISSIRGSKLIDEQIDELKKGPLTVADIQRCQVALLDAFAANNMDFYKAAVKPRLVTLLYRGVRVEIAATSPAHEWQLKHMAVVKSTAVDAGMLPPIWCEADLIGLREAPASQVDEILLKDAKVVRMAAEELMQSDAEDSGAVLRSVLDKQVTILKSIDKTWSIEQAFFETHLGNKGEVVLDKLILKSLPSQVDDVKPDDAYTRLTALSDSRLYKMVGHGGRSHLQHCKKQVMAVSSGQAPSIVTKDASGFVQAMQARLALFCRVPAANGEPAKAGRSALKALLDKMVAQSCVTMKDLNVFHVYSWLLTPDEEKQVKDKTLAIMKGVKPRPDPKTPTKPKKSTSAASKDTASSSKNLFE